MSGEWAAAPARMGWVLALLEDEGEGVAPPGWLGGWGWHEVKSMGGSGVERDRREAFVKVDVNVKGSGRDEG